MLMLLVGWPALPPALAGGDPTPEEQAKLDAGRRAVLPAPDVIGLKLLLGSEDRWFARPGSGFSKGGAYDPHPTPAGSTQPLAGDKPGTKAGAKPAPTTPEPEMVPVSTDERKALAWYVWYLKEKLKKEEAAAEQNPDLKKPDKKGKTRVDKVKDKLTKAEGRLKNMGGEGIADPDMVQDIQKAQADHQQAKAAASAAGGAK
jgi:hypothetical protein